MIKLPGYISVPGYKRGVLNRCEKLWVCNAFATTFHVNPWFSAIFGYPNVNRSSASDNLGYARDNQKRISKMFTNPGNSLCFRGFCNSENIVECRETGWKRIQRIYYSGGAKTMEIYRSGKFLLTFPRLWKNIWNSCRRWRKRSRKSMPWSRQKFMSA